MAAIYESQIATSTTSLSIQEISRMDKEGELVLQPPFQRDLVWNDEQRSYLIDTMLRGLPVPEVYVLTNVDEDGNSETVVVDGQQRISTCLRFLAGDLEISGPDLDESWNGKTFPGLPGPLKAKFRSYKLIARELPPVDDEGIREIFRRFNKAVEPLLPQELRHAAYTGPFIRLVEAAGAMEVVAEIGVFSPRDFRRRRSDELMAEIALAVLSGAYPNKKEGLEDLFVSYERRGMPPEAYEGLSRKFGRVFQQLELLMPGLRRTRFKNKSDFYTLFTQLAARAEQLPLDPDATERLGEILREFSLGVNDAPFDGGDSVSDDASPEVAYRHAVQRAASDRLSRVRRARALEKVWESVFNAAPSAPLSVDDADWVMATEKEVTASDDLDQAEAADERAYMQELLAEGD